MNGKIFGTLALGVLMSGNAFAWNVKYDCVSNNAKKSTVAVWFLDSEILKTRENGSSDRYYRVTDTSEELVEAMILGHKSGEKARLVPVLKGTMNLTMTQMEPGVVTASVKVGKVVTTYSCK